VIKTPFAAPNSYIEIVLNDCCKGISHIFSSQRHYAIKTHTRANWRGGVDGPVPTFPGKERAAMPSQPCSGIEKKAIDPTPKTAMWFATVLISYWVKAPSDYGIGDEWCFQWQDPGYDFFGLNLRLSFKTSFRIAIHSQSAHDVEITEENDIQLRLLHGIDNRSWKWRRTKQTEPYEAKSNRYTTL